MATETPATGKHKSPEPSDPELCTPCLHDGKRYWNCTPHSIHVYADGESKDPAHLVGPCGRVLRCLSPYIRTRHGTYLGAMALAPEIYTELEPDDVKWMLARDGPDAVFIVSLLVGQILGESKEVHLKGTVLGPDTSPDYVVRDDQGRIAGTRAFVCYSHGPSA